MRDAEGIVMDESDEEEQRRHLSTLVLSEGRNLKASHRKMVANIPEDHRVKELPGLSAGDSTGLSHYAGLLEIDAQKGSNIFYWLLEKPEKAEDAPLVIWLNGGPGCSSMDGLWLENGPFRLDGQSNVKMNPYSWHLAANVMYVDQPVGTGFSYTSRKDGYAGNDAAINEGFYAFLIKFFELHNKAYVTTDASGKKKTRPLYFAGESHAGHYIPTIVSHILEKNKAVGLFIDVQAAALGNPWIDPPSQYDASEMAHGLGLITKGQMYNLKEMNKKCQTLLKTGRLRQNICFDLLDVIIDSTAAAGGNKMLMYDARSFVSRPSEFPPGHEALEKYLNRPDVKAALHTTSTPQKFEECTDPPYMALAHQDGLSAAPQLISILDAGIRVLVFSGQYDLVCHHLGTENLLMDLSWSGNTGWQKADTGVWVVDNSPAGYIKQFKNLQSLVVLDSGHMVPMNQPKRALDMFKKFVENKPFSAGTTKLHVSTTIPDEMCPSQHRRASEEWGSAGSYLSSTMDTFVDASDLPAAMQGYGQTAMISSFLTIGVVIVIVVGFFSWRACAQNKQSGGMKK
jgi:carboxypeptidase D